jgi:hypothetical protein
MRKLIVILMLILVLLSGCTSLSSWLRSNIEGVPVWVYEPQVGRNQLAYVGVGQANNEARARILAYESILTQLSSYIGEDISTKHFRELSSGGSIEAYRLNITQEFVKRDQSGNTVYFLAVADRTRLETARTVAEKLLLEQQQQISRLVASAAEAFRENRDIDAAELYLDAAMIAASMPVERGVALYTTNLGRAEKIINDLTISVSKGDPTIPTTVVIVRRGRRTLSPKVVNARVLAYTNARNGLGEPYADSQTFYTDGNGQFSYFAQNPGISGSGEIQFTIGFNKSIEALQSVDPERAKAIQTALDAKTIAFPYRRISPMGERGIVVALMEYSIDGVLLDSTVATDTLIEEYSYDGFRVVSGMAQANIDDDEFLQDIQRAFPSYQYLIVGKAGISLSSSAAGSPTITVTGEVTLKNLRTNADIHSVGEIVSSGSGQTEKDAVKTAFARFGLITSSILDKELYR